MSRQDLGQCSWLCFSAALVLGLILANDFRKMNGKIASLLIVEKALYIGPFILFVLLGIWLVWKAFLSWRDEKRDSPSLG